MKRRKRREKRFTLRRRGAKGAEKRFGGSGSRRDAESAEGAEEGFWGKRFTLHVVSLGDIVRYANSVPVTMCVNTIFIN